ncbi:MAG: hypothetical protein QOE19_787 [Actinomycetota bacterium]|jgi:uncharacterized short protein YbdD (DUF466 family)|nr:hypothetical protein [Actinomycetota bacterium]
MMLTAVRRAGRGMHWYLKQLTGEAKWDDYLDRCRSERLPPVSRREFERHRAEHNENTPGSRCC